MSGKIKEDSLARLVVLFKDLFINRADRLARQSPLRYKPENIGIGRIDSALLDHLSYRKTYGAYAYSAEGLCKWMCVDLDLVKGLEIDKQREALLDAARTIERYLIERFEVDAEAIRIEFSGGKGFHVWIFLAEPVHVYRIQSFWRAFKADLPDLPPQVEPRLERFPHQATDPTEKQFGAQVKMPCCKHQRSGGYSYFVDDAGNPVDPLAALSAVRKWSLPEYYESVAPTVGVSPDKKKTPQKQAPIEILVPNEEPVLHGDVERAFRNCKMLARFREQPESVSYDEWKSAGIVLTMLGEEGEAWFRWLSYQDGARWDSSHQELIDSIKSEAIRHLPACAPENSPECAGCPYKSVLEAAAQRFAERYKPEWIGERPAPQYMDLDELRSRQRESIGAVIDSGHAGVYLVNTPVGAGKSQAACQVIQEKGKRALWYAPNNHDQAEEIASKFAGQAMCIYGRDYMVEHRDFNCSHHTELKQGASLGVPLEAHYCHGECPKREMCEYQDQFKEATRKPVVILMHQHLALRRSKLDDLLQDRDVIVIDEDFLPVFRSSVTITKDELQRLRLALSAHGDGWAVIKQWIDPLIRLYDEGEHFVLPRLSVSKRLMNCVSGYFQTGTEGRNVMGDLMRAMGKATIRIKQIDAARFYWFVHTVPLPQDKPILILDASGDVEDYRMALGSDYNVEQVNPLDGRKLRKQVHVTQLVTGSYPNATLLGREHDDSLPGQIDSAGKTSAAIIQYIRQRINPDEKTGIITTKKYLPILQQAFQDTPGIIYGHYKKLRGVNAFEEVDTLFVVGYQGIEYMEISKQARVWFDQEWDDKVMAASLETERHWRWLSYYKDGLGYKVKHLYPSNPYVRAFVNDNYAEVDQAVGRIRPYNPIGRQRRVFILTNIPVSIEVDEIDFLSGVKSQETLNKVMAAAGKLLHEQGRFTFSELQAESGVPKRTLRDYAKPMCESMQLMTERGKKKHVFLRAEDALEQIAAQAA